MYNLTPVFIISDVFIWLAHTHMQTFMSLTHPWWWFIIRKFIKHFNIMNHDSGFIIGIAPKFAKSQ